MRRAGANPEAGRLKNNFFQVPTDVRTSPVARRVNVSHALRCGFNGLTAVTLVITGFVELARIVCAAFLSLATPACFTTGVRLAGAKILLKSFRLFACWALPTRRRLFSHRLMLFVMLALALRDVWNIEFKQLKAELPVAMSFSHVSILLQCSKISCKRFS